MSNHRDSSLDLEVVRDRFVKASERLEAIEQHTRTMMSTSSQLSEAKAAVLLASKDISKLASTMTSLTQELDELTRTLRLADRTTMAHYVEQLNQDSTKIKEDIRRMKGRLGDLEAATEETKQALELNINNISTLVDAVAELRIGVDRIHRYFTELGNIKQLVYGALVSSALAAALVILNLLR